ncbi:hypothetical protein [uncultured Lentibacter sp.]|uniref:hypothetical protein n=1 Tax=uncultured Lentibacter sp. TaxID=1659309 RepID=UPI0026179CB2|nr:hypothetical protein [uncultured Lentibacter sp.]
MAVNKDQQLLDVLEAQRSEALACFQKVCARIAHTNTILIQLGQTDEEPDPAYQSLGVDMLWRNWIERRRTAIMYELARLHAEREDAAQRLKRANGRAKAFEAVLKKQQSSRQLVANRKLAAGLTDLVVSHNLVARR